MAWAVQAVTLVQFKFIAPQVGAFLKNNINVRAPGFQHSSGCLLITGGGGVGGWIMVGTRKKEGTD